jgi:hypothetical protein
MNIHDATKWVFIFFCGQQVHAPSQKHVPRITSEKNLHNKTENLSHTLDTSVCARCGASVTYFTLRLLIHYHHPFYYPIFFMLASLCARLTPCSSRAASHPSAAWWVYDVRYCCYDSAANHASYCACLRLINQKVHVSIGMKSRF